MRRPRMPAAAGHPAVIGAVLLGGAVALLVGTGVAVVRSASSPAGSSGLTYSVLGADVRAALELVPAERWLRVDSVSAQVEGQRVSFEVGRGPKGPRAENVRRTST